ncbi:probable integrase/recombinase (plasmid) [Rhodococcus jostii RHA1]|uniref:Probable integrase/recombinase n=1 Tax=Rhodococcus jostii (strain RHA1) TaxID=101510 RepID=Q0RY13_RHOJR|nr:tyrosine-type recombinase/integrase [Rhodococcus jostii]ABG99823.1 probable integrase/recombinase [Rhodococcus jostii RHA1]
MSTTSRSATDSWPKQDTRLQRGNIGPVFRSSLEKTANMLLEFKLAGKVAWRRRRPMSTQLRSRFETALRLFDESLSGTLAVGSVELAVGEIRQLLTHLRDRGHVASPHTIESARRAWNMLLRHVCDTGGIPVDKITFPMLDRACITGFLEQTRAERNWTAATYNQRLACIRSFFEYAATAEPTLAIHLADLAGIPLMKAPATKPVSHMSQQAIKALLAQPDPIIRTGLRDQFFMILMYDTAARDAEMLSAAIGDLDAQRLTIDLLGKGSKPRRIPITKETAAHYRRYTAAFHPDPQLGDPLFYTIHSHRKTRMSDDNAARIIRQHAQAAHRKCAEVPAGAHPHMLRHSRAMHLYQAGMPLALLTEWLGHADPETTLIYAHADTK